MKEAIVVVLWGERLRANILTLLSDAQEATVLCRMWLLDKFTCREACWRCPAAGWEDGRAKAGERENNWYGVFGAEWLDDWCLEEMGDEVRV